MTRPHSSVLASRVEPHMRDYISAVVSEETTPIKGDVTGVMDAVLANNAALVATIGELQARVNDLDALLKLPSYKIAKLLELAGKE